MAPGSCGCDTTTATVPTIEGVGPCGCDTTGEATVPGDLVMPAEACSCGCECCAEQARTVESEVAQLATLRQAIDRRLAELGV